MTLGKVHLEMLNFCTSCQVEDKHLKIANESIVTFEGIGVEFPSTTISNEMSVCKSLFKKANTQFKRSMKTFVLDGFVTEHVNMLLDINKLYKFLGRIEKVGKR